jgi:hypothetical protein
VRVVGAVAVRAAVAGDLAADGRRRPIQLPGDLGVPETVRQPGRDLSPVLVCQPASGHRSSSVRSSSDHCNDRRGLVAFDVTVIAQIATFSSKMQRFAGPELIATRLNAT